MRSSASGRIRRRGRRPVPLGAYLAEHDLAGMPGSVLIRQGAQVGRPSELFVETGREDGGWRVRVGAASTWSAGGRSSSELARGARSEGPSGFCG